MCATEQTEGVRSAHDLIVDLRAQHHRVTTMKHAPMEIVKVMPSYQARGRRAHRGPVQDSSRIQGGNWSMQGFRRSGHVHDEDECQMSIAEFMGTRERFESDE
jgi:hypothetical protein